MIAAETERVPSFAFQLSGEPVGKGRPKARRVGRGIRIYTPQATVDAEARVLEAWQKAGAVRLAGPIALDVMFFHERPASHYRTNGELSAEGDRHPEPYRTKPDLDNAVKLVMDALNGHAWRDDVRVVRLRAERRWANTGLTLVVAQQLT